MAAPKVHPRPKPYPPPEFPPRQPKLFAQTPPALFPVILGLFGLGLGLRAAVAGAAMPLAGPVEAVLGAVLALWGFAMLALAVKIGRRPAVVLEDLKVLPGRAGLAAAGMGVMAAAGVLLPYAPKLAFAVVLCGLALHLVLALALLWVMARGPKEARGVNPSWHLSFVGFIVAAPVLVRLGQAGLAEAILVVTGLVAVAIWGLSLVQLLRRIPPAPLRPMLAIHLAPAALISVTAGLLGQSLLATGMAGFGAVILLALLASARWLTAAGVTPLWGAFTFPLSAFALALWDLGGLWQQAGAVVLLAACLLVPWVAWNVLKLWPGGRLAAKTNAAEA